MIEKIAEDITSIKKCIVGRIPLLLDLIDDSRMDAISQELSYLSISDNSKMDIVKEGIVHCMVNNIQNAETITLESGQKFEEKYPV